MIPHTSSEVKPPPRIPFAFRADPVALDALKLPQTARAVFVLLLDNAKSRGWRSRLSNATIGRILGRCPMTISRALGRLESAGLISRELAAGGRIRTGILVTWDGVRRERLTEQPSVRRECATGSAHAPEGLGARAELTRAGIQGGEQTGPILPLGEEPGEVPDGPTAARYLRAMIQAGRKGTHQACIPAAPTRPVSTSPAGDATKDGTPRVIKIDNSAPTPSHDDVRRVVERMAGGIFLDARRAAWGPLPGRPRHPSQAEQLAALERRKLRRKGGRR